MIEDERDRRDDPDDDVSEQDLPESIDAQPEDPDTRGRETPEPID